ncbi:MAG: FadR family transcriptional regulator [Chloroflexi bacterium]|nr:FadR family transcriptional regulator [Chloroflexota bacterium]
MTPKKPPPVFKPIEPQKVTMDAIRQLQDSIQKGYYPPGSQLPSERDLAQQLNISRPSVREAISFLEALGLVTSITGRGTFVNEMAGHNELPSSLLGSENPLHILETREILEIGLAGHAAQRRTSEDLTIMRQLLERMNESSIDVATFLEIDMEFHLQIAKASQNPVLVQLMTTVEDLMRRGAWRTVKERSSSFRKRLNRYREDHQNIYEAIEQGDSEAAQECMQEHLRGVIADFTPS